MSNEFNKTIQHNTTIISKLINQIETERLIQGLTVKDVADAGEVSRQSYYNAKNGGVEKHDIGILKLLKMAGKVGLRVDFTNTNIGRV